MKKPQTKIEIVPVPKQRLMVVTSVLRAVAPALLLALLTSSVALAKPKVPGDSGVETQLKLQVGDEPGNEVKELKTEMLVMRSEKRALDEAQRLAKKYKGKRMEPEILFRLAELYMRRARTERFFEIHKNSDEVMTFAPSLVKQASEATEIKKAITIYLDMQARFPSFHSMDVVIFNNAYAYQQIGDDKSAEALYFKLIRGHRDSNLVPDSYLAIGEINYNRRNFKFALENFTAIRQFKGSRVYPYGLYKAAWCYYNLQDAASGLKQLEEVVRFGREMAKQHLDAKLDLRKEALGDMALFYGDVKPATAAVDYFREMAQELDAAPYIMRLVELYKHHSRYNDIELVLKDILVKLPTSEIIASVHEELVWNYERMRLRPKAVASLADFDAFCASQPNVLKVKPDAAAAKKVAKNAEPVLTPHEDCRNKIADASKKLATKWHAQWKKQGGDEPLAQSSEKAYRLYLKDGLPTDAERPQIHYSFAELQFARGQYRDASESYSAVDDYRKSFKVDAKVAHDAAYGAVVSLERAVGEKKWSDPDEKRFQVLADVYTTRFPAGVYSLEIKYKRAFIAYEKEHYEEAAPQFYRIGWVDKHEGVPGGITSEKVLKAQDLYLDILNIKKDYTGLKEAAKSLLGRPSSPERTKVVQKVYREAYFSEIQQMEEKGKFAEAVESYKRFALENPTSELASKAWWNASQLQFKLGDAEGGANTCYQMYKLFPTSSNGKDCLTKAAQTFESMARLDLAARVLLNLANVEVEKQDKWRETAADFFALSGSKARAITMYLKMADEAKKNELRVGFFEKAAVVAGELKDQKTLDAIEAKYSQLNIEPQASRMIVEQAEAALKDGDQNRAFNLSKKIVGRTSLPKALQARARIVQAQVLESEYRQQSVKARTSRLGIVLAIKTEKLEKVQKAYQSAIAYGDAGQSVRALRMLAGCYIDYSHTVRGMSLGHVSEADQKAFSDEIEQLSVPMEEKGIESMNQALQTSKKAQLHTGEVADIQAELDKLNMKTNKVPPVQVVDPAMYVPSFTRAPASEAGL